MEVQNSGKTDTTKLPIDSLWFEIVMGKQV